MANRKKTLKDKLTLTPTSDWVDPASPHGGKKSRVYTSGTMYEQDTGRYQTRGLGGVDTAAKGHGKKKTPNVGAWNRATVKRGEPVPGASRGVGQETVDGFIEGLEKRKKGKGARR